MKCSNYLEIKTPYETTDNKIFKPDYWKIEGEVKMLHGTTSEKIFEIGDKFYMADLSYVQIHGKHGDRDVGVYFDGGCFIENELLKGHPFIVVSEPYEVKYDYFIYDDYDYSKYSSKCTDCDYRIDVMICDCEDTPVLSILNRKENIIEDFNTYRNIIEELDFERLGGVF